MAGPTTSSQYDQLTASIKKTIDDQNAMFTSLQSANNGAFLANKQAYQIEQGLTDVKSQRDDVWNYLQGKYKENTKLRAFLFEKQVATKKQLDAQAKELAYLHAQLTDTSTKFDTSSRSVKNEIYTYNRYAYFAYLYKLLITIQLLLILVLVLCLYDIIPFVAGFIIVVGVFFITALYLVYYIYYNNQNRDLFDWDKYYIAAPGQSAGSQCVPVVSAETKELNKLAANANTLLAKYINPPPSES